jgi:hypothetical protein
MAYSKEELIGSVPDWIVLALELVAKGSKTPLKAIQQAAFEKMPEMFEGRKDLRANFEQLWALLAPDKCALLMVLRGEMDALKWRLFQSVVVDKMSPGTGTVYPQGSPPAVTDFRLTPNDYRVDYLVRIADEVIAATKGGTVDLKVAAKKVAGDLESRGVFSRSPMHEAWSKSVSGFEKKFAEFFGVNSLDEITAEKVERGLQRHVERLVRDNPDVLSFDEDGLHSQIPGVFSIMGGQLLSFFRIKSKRSKKPVQDPGAQDKEIQSIHPSNQESSLWKVSFKVADFYMERRRSR